MDTFIMIGQFVVSLSLLIILHELGHFIPARLFKTRVEKFYLFFDFWLGSLFKVKRGETEYGIGWLPLGGYVKIAGMIDESNDKSFLQTEPQPWEFRSKKAWQRLIIMLGGVTVNFLVGILIMIGVVFTYGDQNLLNSSIQHGITVDSLGEYLGLRDGDHLIAVGNKPIKYFNAQSVKRDLVISGVNTITVKRQGRDTTITVPEDAADVLSLRRNKRMQVFMPRIPLAIDGFTKESPAQKAGIKATDRIVAVQGQPTDFVHQLTNLLRKNKDSIVLVTVLRGADTLNLPVHVSKEGMIGIKLRPLDKFFQFEDKKYSIFESIPEGYRRATGVLKDQISAFGQIFRGKIKLQESLGGFGTMSSLYGTTWNWQRFWSLTAMISMILAFMNLLPIPALDGGHVLFLLFEMVTGIKPSEKVLEYAGTIGFFLVLALLLFANAADVMGCMKGY